MPSAVWPPSLPQGPRLEDLEETPPTLAIRTGMDVGPAKVRRRAVAGVTSGADGFTALGCTVGNTHWM